MGELLTDEGPKTPADVLAKSGLAAMFEARDAHLATLTTYASDELAGVSEGFEAGWMAARKHDCEIVHALLDGAFPHMAGNA